MYYNNLLNVLFAGEDVPFTLRRVSAIQELARSQKGEKFLRIYKGIGPAVMERGGVRYQSCTSQKNN